MVLGELNELSLEELQSLFEDDDGQATPPVEEEVKTDEDVAKKDLGDTKNITTKAFSERLKKSTEKAVNEEREKIAKQLGYNSYEEMIKQKEVKILEEKGLDPEQVTPVVEELVKQRLDNDPRMKELSNFREQRKLEFAKKELDELSKLTDGEIRKIEDVPKDVLELWKTKGSLKSAYLELKGEELVNKARGKYSKGSTEHLQQIQGSNSGDKDFRPLTAEEKNMWKYFNPGISDEELNKKTVKI